MRCRCTELWTRKRLRHTANEAVLGASPRGCALYALQHVPSSGQQATDAWTGSPTAAVMQADAPADHDCVADPTENVYADKHLLALDEQAPQVWTDPLSS